MVGSRTSAGAMLVTLWKIPTSPGCENSASNKAFQMWANVDRLCTVDIFRTMASTRSNWFLRLLLYSACLEGIRLRLRAIHADAFLLFARIKSRPLSLTSDSIMVIAPHQDDETFGCGGLIALQREGGATVKVVFLTDGGNSPLASN